MPHRTLLSLALGLALAACASDPAPPPPPAAAVVDFDDACQVENDGAELQVVGYADAFPTAFSCFETEDGSRLCPVDLYAAQTSVLEPDARVGGDSAVALELRLPEGEAPNHVDPTGFGAGPALVLVADDGVRADPYDRVRVTGRFAADADASGGTAVLCHFDEVRQVDVVEAASPSWREAAGEGETMDAFLDSLNAERSQVE